MESQNGQWQHDLLQIEQRRHTLLSSMRGCRKIAEITDLARQTAAVSEIQKIGEVNLQTTMEIEKLQEKFEEMEKRHQKEAGHEVELEDEIEICKQEKADVAATHPMHGCHMDQPSCGISLQWKHQAAPVTPVYLP